VAITTPVPRPPCDLSIRPRRPLDDALTSPWVSADSLPFLSGAPDLSTSFRPTCSPMVSPTDVHSELGPRSLDPGRPFRERVCRAYLGPDSAYRLLQLAFIDMRATKPELSILAGTMASTTFLVSSATPSSLRKQWQPASRVTPDSLRPRCRFLPLSRVCPTAMPFRTHHPRGVSPKRLSDDLRARVSGPSEGRVALSKRDDQVSPVGCVRLFSARADVVPLLGAPEDIRCHRCDRRQERSSCQRDGPTKLSIPSPPREG
jgi:hypothetical protein